MDYKNWNYKQYRLTLNPKKDYIELYWFPLSYKLESITAGNWKNARRYYTLCFITQIYHSVYSKGNRKHSAPVFNRIHRNFRELE